MLTKIYMVLATHFWVFNIASQSLEVYYSPFQTRIGGLEYQINKVNEERTVFRSSVRTFAVNDLEFGLNYLFDIKKAKFGAGISYYSDSYKFAVNARYASRIFDVSKGGVSVNLFYRKLLFKNTTLDLGVNTRIQTSYRNNRDEYSDNVLIFPAITTYDERWYFSFPVELVPSIQFNTHLIRGFYLRYGVFAKFWGGDFFTVRSNNTTTNERILDFSANLSNVKGVISIGYSFNK